MGKSAKLFLNIAALLSMIVGVAGLAEVLGGSEPVPGWIGFALISAALILAAYANVRWQDPA